MAQENRITVNNHAVKVEIKDTISPTLRQIGYLDIKADIAPAMRGAMTFVENAVRRNVADRDPYNGSLTRLAVRGVKSKPFSYGVGFTTYLDSHIWLYIFNAGSKERKTKEGLYRGRISGLFFMQAAKAEVEPVVFDMLRNAIFEQFGKKLGQ
ncbi:hypothetical protein [Prevotella sp. KH2C16]|uniref:hypothetical protein n=1 Tax=Prevotella sp. KH2C16 TaxID=1855325 RepID=UPI0008E53BD1|nr:hypothetical protein [Prevotella sp. KH2C16]SFF96506.1 hypothetical protein SAMN05216383_1038 [Prevotella sp. KH2C16]